MLVCQQAYPALDTDLFLYTLYQGSRETGEEAITTQVTSFLMDCSRSSTEILLLSLTVNLSNPETVTSLRQEAMSSYIFLQQLIEWSTTRCPAAMLKYIFQNVHKLMKATKPWNLDLKCYLIMIFHPCLVTHIPMEYKLNFMSNKFTESL